MTTEKFHKIILLSSLIILICIILDTYIVPTRCTFEIVKTKQYFRQRQLSKSSIQTYTIQTNERTFDVNYGLYSTVSNNDTIITYSSELTNKVQNVSVQKEGYMYTCKVGYLNAFFGLFAIPFTLTGLIIFFIFYRKLNNIEGRRRLTYSILICTFVQLFFYLDN